jgi:hypothetical protein
LLLGFEYRRAANPVCIASMAAPNHFELGSGALGHETKLRFDTGLHSDLGGGLALGLVTGTPGGQ